MQITYKVGRSSEWYGKEGQRRDAASATVSTDGKDGGGATNQQGGKRGGGAKNKQRTPPFHAYLSAVEKVSRMLVW